MTGEDFAFACWLRSGYPHLKYLPRWWQQSIWIKNQLRST
jgi:hypothetical protein